MIDSDIAKELGEIKGMLKGVALLMDEQNKGTHRRMDDLHNVVTQRLDSQEAEMSRVRERADEAIRVGTANHTAIQDMHRNAMRAGGMSGAGVAGLITAGIELAKAFLKHS